MDQISNQASETGDSQVGKFAYSTNGEDGFFGEFDSAEEAVLEYAGLEPEDPKEREEWLEESVYVGEIRKPHAASDWIDGLDIIERIQNDSEDYQGEWAENWPGASKEQVEELTQSLRAAFDAWEAKHGLKPKFFMVDGSEKMSVRDALESLAFRNDSHPESDVAGSGHLPDPSIVST